MNEIRSEQMKDATCNKIKQFCSEGWPQNVIHDVKPFYAHRSDLSVQRGLLMYRDRLVIPTSMRENILERLHAGHQGVVKTRALAKTSVWWPGLSKQINELVERCPECAKERKTQTSPMMPTAVPDYPWQRIGTDIFEFRGENYLVVIDYFSKFIEIALLKKHNFKINQRTVKCFSS